MSSAYDPKRYARQVAVRQIGAAGQERFAAATVLLVGCGGLGSTHAELLARLGIGALHVADRDVVETGNLPRQLLYDEAAAAAGTPKAVAAAARLARINSRVALTPLPLEVTAANVEELVRPVDLVLDGTDNVATRYLLNDACVKFGKPWIYGGVAGTGGLAYAVVPGKGPCLRCLFPEPPATAEVPNCNTAGVLNTAVVQVAATQVTLACQHLLGLPVAGTLVQLDLWTFRQHRSQVARDPACPCCGRREFPFLANSAEPLAASVCGQDAVRIAARFWREYGIPAAAIPGQLRRAGVQVDELGLLHEIQADSRRFTLFPDGTVLAHGGTDTTAALAALKKLATAIKKP